ncbi:DUF456 domain-containing protein [Mesonia sediminis]|uniref:DUF456 domain-containing protein n=1 Tax=Mesonia sediminis TaxID=1703946 RepID=A0ABW5SAW9_9FLAO
MDVFLLICGFLLCCTGIAGSFLPVLPGISLSWLGLVLLAFTKAVPANYWLLGITLFICIVILILDYIIPAQGTKKFGGGKAAAYGTSIGLIIGLFVPIPFGFLIGAFLGAFLGELLFVKASTFKKSLKAAVGSFLGFLASTFMAFFTACIYLGIFIYQVVIHWNNFF